MYQKNILFCLLHSAAWFRQLTKASCTMQQAFFQLFLHEPVSFRLKNGIFALLQAAGAFLMPLMACCTVQQGFDNCLFHAVVCGR
jgi:hypothetical protein